MDDLKLTVVTFNLEDGGWNHRYQDHRNLDRLPEMLEQAGDVDVLLFQEEKSYEARGQELLFRAEGLLAPFGLRGFLTQSQRGRLHEIVFIRWPRLRPLWHYVPGPGTFREQVGLLATRLEGLNRELVLKSVQWINWSGDLRLEEAQRLTRWAAPGQAAIIGGDFNSLWPDCRRRRRPWRPRVHREFEPNWAALPPHKRLHKSLQPGSRPRRFWSRREQLVSDRRALTVLAEAGFVSAGCAANDMTVTVNAEIDHGQGARIDHIAVSPWLGPAIVPGSYRVWPTGQVSDHRMVSVQLDLGRAER